MLYAYVSAGAGLAPLANDQDLAQAIWIDLYRPLDSQVQAVSALGYEVPTLDDMEEIEISNRLYTESGKIYMTGVLPGQLPNGESAAMPVTFILGPTQLITVRHHAPRPFETFPTRADRSSSGCASPERVFLGLVEEIVGRLADISENVSKVLDTTAARVLRKTSPSNSDFLETALMTIGQQAELMGRIRMGLLSMDRILVYHASNTASRPDAHGTRALRTALQRDIQALEVHADFLTSRIGMTIDATMGMIGLQQNERVRILSVMTALFLPPTLIASIYGMNFDRIPALQWSLGFPMALALMVCSVAAVLVLLKWKDWL
ncbi:magnesium transporter CorA family protein [Paracoccus laeviglucosivorans]|uniref:Magnesium transporter n=1 Tax=Paracoccus laeviglucosivorans TaxID=1197861 RepID=A0A521ACP6_9RHOB|nr:magnesium transporter CorA family protein [Paracoccus laeviglucosivorans]SMO32548.1 magnesium transporter [Paracoccus laeviglucosivorans]